MWLKIVLSVIVVNVVTSQFTLAPEDDFPEFIRTALLRYKSVDPNVGDVDRLVFKISHFRSKSLKLEKIYKTGFKKLIDEVFLDFGKFGTEGKTNMATISNIKGTLNQLLDVLYRPAPLDRKYELEYLVDLYYELCALQWGRREVNFITPHQVFLMIARDFSKQNPPSAYKVLDNVVLPNVENLLIYFKDSGYTSLTRYIVKAFDQISKYDVTHPTNEECFLDASGWLLELKDQMKGFQILGEKNVDNIIEYLGKRK